MWKEHNKLIFTDFKHSPQDQSSMQLSVNVHVCVQEEIQAPVES